jgi:hypothetical protein
MVLAERGSYKKLEKRPANEGLFIVFGAGRGNITRFLLPPGFCRRSENRVAGADEQDDYFYPRSILGNEGAGRWWAMNNTSNIPGVE